MYHRLVWIIRSYKNTFVKETIEKKVYIALSRWESVKSKLRKMVREHETTQMNTMWVGRRRDMKKQLKWNIFHQNSWRKTSDLCKSWKMATTSGLLQNRQRSGRNQSWCEIKHALSMFDGNGSSNTSSIDLHSHYTHRSEKSRSLWISAAEEPCAPLTEGRMAKKCASATHVGWWAEGWWWHIKTKYTHIYTISLMTSSTLNQSHLYLWRENMAVQ